jgi:phosphoribosyl-AMP cyclohydrolase / phosphoribosyl-ATP pyrophosphohydrolase
MLDLAVVDFEKGGGVVTVITQDATSGAVLMTAFADREALERTMSTGEMHYRSRTRGLWHKGATSGHVQRVVSLTMDCDRDAVLARVHSAGPACHTGLPTCFDGEDDPAPPADVFAALDATIVARMLTVDPLGEPSYTQRLLRDRNLRLKKVGEEASELVLACADQDRERAVSEAADLIYHALVALRAVGGSVADVRSELARRHVASS